MNKFFFFTTLIFLMLISSCSHHKVNESVAIVSASSGLMKNNIAAFPIYLTDELDSRSVLEKKLKNKLFIIHTGHFLKPNLSKAENEKTLESLRDLGIDIVNLTLEDFAVAQVQEINFEKYNQIFLNSTVLDLNSDEIALAKNIIPYVMHNDVAFIGLSDNKLDKKLPKDRYIINDYVASILKVKKNALKAVKPKIIRSFVIIHKLGNEINDVMERLPPSFINSLAD
jgi:hypothetical protein